MNTVYVFQKQPVPVSFGDRRETLRGPQIERMKDRAVGLDLPDRLVQKLRFDARIFEYRLRTEVLENHPQRGSVGPHYFQLLDAPAGTVRRELPMDVPY